jgi:hypothetical protein
MPVWYLTVYICSVTVAQPLYNRGLRILCLDGGGTRGVLTVALLKKVRTNFSKDAVVCLL